MCRPAYVQHQLATLAPPGITPEETIRFNIVLGVEDGRIALRLELDKSRSLDFIPIGRDSVVEIALQGEQLYFSKDMDAITTKEPLAALYGGLEYDGYEEKFDRYRIVRFAARYNQGGKIDTTHGFNVNVHLLQRFVDDEPRWIPLTIDPDIKNPPPMLMRY